MTLIPWGVIDIGAPDEEENEFSFIDGDSLAQFLEDLVLVPLFDVERAHSAFLSASVVKQENKHAQAEDVDGNGDNGQVDGQIRDLEAESDQEHQDHVE